MTVLAHAQQTSTTDPVRTHMNPQDTASAVLTAPLQAPMNSQREPDIESSGLVVDETQTKIGHDFYDLFYTNWTPDAASQGYTIVISERAYPRLGAMVIVRVNDYEVFQNFIQPRLDAIEESALYAVAFAMDYLANYEAIQQELEGADLKGTGIF
jgi:curli production assembly/transport component CsgE